MTDFPLGRPLDDGQVLVGAVEVVEYMDADGEMRFRVRVMAEMQTSSALGLMRLAEHSLLQDVDELED